MENKPEAVKEIISRKATLSDLETIRKLNQELCLKENRQYDSTINPDYANTKSGEEYFRSRIEQPDCFAILAEEEGVAVGYLIGSLIPSEDYRTVTKLAEGENMYVKGAFRGRGVGTKLVKQFEVWCREKGVQVIRYVASAENTEGIKFYKTQGLKEISVTLEKKLDEENKL
jgi:ribosomal protein S18 acetylase RimI-like enzyme